MRTLKPVLRWLSAGILALTWLFASFAPVWSDTGTYRITSYFVTLEPQSDGQVKITYDQTWQVTGGNIPWITVGLPNRNFSILKFSGAAASAGAENSSGFTGIRIDLDKKYLAGESFRVQFSILQNNLLERLTSEKEWQIVFTPGWYDRTGIDKMQITLISPVDVASYNFSPAPKTSQDRVIIWEKSELSSGQRFNVVISCSDGSFLSETGSINQSASKGIFTRAFFITICVIVLIGLLIFLAIYRYKKKRDAELKTRIENYEKEMAEDKAKKTEIESGFKEYLDQKEIKQDAEGRYYDRSYGDYITPAIWAAVIFSQTNRRREASTAAGANPTPHHPSCACVSCACACACACASGGAAGCSKKTLHECLRDSSHEIEQKANEPDAKGLKTGGRK
jgi:hypothetical protein